MREFRQFDKGTTYGGSRKEYSNNIAKLFPAHFAAPIEEIKNYKCTANVEHHSVTYLLIVLKDTGIVMLMNYVLSISYHNNKV